MKKLRAAGTRKKYEKSSPTPNKIPEPSVIGRSIFLSFFVIPGKT